MTSIGSKNTCYAEQQYKDSIPLEQYCNEEKSRRAVNTIGTML
jgi:hypothetical protein